MDRKIVFRIAENIIAILEKMCELELEMTISYNLIENAFLWDDILLLFYYERARFADFYKITNFRLSCIDDGHGIDMLSKGFYNRSICFKF